MVRKAQKALKVPKVPKELQAPRDMWGHKELMVPLVRRGLTVPKVPKVPRVPQVPKERMELRAPRELAVPKEPQDLRERTVLLVVRYSSTTT